MLLLKGDGGRESETACVGVCIESVYIFIMCGCTGFKSKIIHTVGLWMNDCA